MKNDITQALILAGGKGMRLRPYTTILPKPMMPIGDMPILEIVFRQLKYSGFDSIILAVGYMEHLFRAYFGDGSKYGLKISYSIEENPLGTAGPLSLVIDQLDENFLVMNGDLLTTLNYKNLTKFHINSSSAATIALHSRNVDIDYGVVHYDNNNQLIKYEEKPVIDFSVSMGINILNKESILRFLSPGEFLDLPDLIMKLKENQLKICCYSEDCEWLDIGRVEDYKIASDRFNKNKSKFLK